MCLGSCNNAYNAETAAERYCDCMKTNKAQQDFNKAANVCIDKLIEENRYYKLWKVDMRNRNLNNRMTNETRDSVKLFISRFITYTDIHCCKEVLACPDSTELK